MAESRPDRDEARIAATLEGMTEGDATLEPLPPDLWARIEAELGTEADLGTDRRPVPVPGARSGRAVGRRRLGLPLALAAAVLVAVLAAVSIVAIGDDDGRVAATVTLSPEQLPAGPPDAGGGASLVAEGDERRLELDLSGLPSPDGFYEVWLLGPDLDRFQSLGATDGSGALLVPAGLDLGRYRSWTCPSSPSTATRPTAARAWLRGRLRT